MKMIASLFEILWEMSLIASIVIGCVLLARCFMHRLPKKYSYMLWLVVLFRLICPVSVSSEFSIFNLAHFRVDWSGATVTEAVTEFPGEDITHTNYIYEDAVVMENYAYETAVHTYTLTELSIPARIRLASGIWFFGVAAILFYSIRMYMKFREKVSGATLLRDNIYECENIPSPFVMGIILPKIYIPYRLTKEEQSYILAHENYHIRRCDHLIKMAAFFMLTVYWFNPLVWVSYILMCRDMEMSCDEKVLSQLGVQIKQDYSTLLLSFAMNKRLNFAGPLAFGETDTGKRVKNVLRFQQPKVWGSVLGVVLLAAVILGCATNEATERVVVEADGVDHNSETEWIDGELINVEVDPVTSNQVEDAVIHNYPATEEAVGIADPEELRFIQDLAIAFCERDGAAINDMVTEEGRAVLEEHFLLETHGDAYSFGWSSPWPMNPDTDWRILSVKDGKAEILFYAWTSDPHISVWRMEVSYEKTDGKYLCMPGEIVYLDAIGSEEEFFMAYPGGAIRGTQMDYETNGMGEALNENAKANRGNMPAYEALFSPDTAAVSLLNLDSEAIRIHPGREDSDENGAKTVEVMFEEGGKTISIKMEQPFGEDGIWIVLATEFFD